MSRTVLCIVELDNYPEVVVARATWLARTQGCRLELLVSDPVTNFLGESFVYLLETQLIADSIRDMQAEAVDRLARSAEAAGVDVEVTTSNERHVAHMVVQRAEKCEPRFVVKGTHFHTPLERATFAGTDWQLIRELECPLWFVKPDDWVQRPLILAAVDPVSAHDKPALLDQKIVATAKEIAAHCDGRLQLVHMYQSLEEIGSRAMWTFKPVQLDVDQINRNIREEHRRAVTVLAEVCKVPAGAVHLIPGRPYELLPSFARTKRASLVVMGALQRSGLRKRIIGSTAARVLDHLPCDVLIVHADWH